MVLLRALCFWDDQTYYVISLSLVKQPRKEVNDYVVGEEITARIPGYKGDYTGRIIMISADSKALHGEMKRLQREAVGQKQVKRKTQKTIDTAATKKKKVSNEKEQTKKPEIQRNAAFLESLSVFKDRNSSTETSSHVASTQPTVLAQTTTPAHTTTPAQTYTPAQATTVPAQTTTSPQIYFPVQANFPAQTTKPAQNITRAQAYFPIQADFPAPTTSPTQNIALAQTYFPVQANFPAQTTPTQNIAQAQTYTQVETNFPAQTFTPAQTTRLAHTITPAKTTIPAQTFPQAQTNPPAQTITPAKTYTPAQANFPATSAISTTAQSSPSLTSNAIQTYNTDSPVFHTPDSSNNRQQAQANLPAQIITPAKTYTPAQANFPAPTAIPTTAQSSPSLTSNVMQTYNTDSPVFHTPDSSNNRQHCEPGTSYTPHEVQSQVLYRRLPNRRPFLERLTEQSISSVLGDVRETFDDASSGSSFTPEVIEQRETQDSNLVSCCDCEVLRSDCQVLRTELAAAKEEIARLELAVSSRSTGSHNRQQDGLPRAGLVPVEAARAHQMAELLPGTGVYLYPKDLRVVGKKEKGTSMARYLLSVFYNNKELVENGNLTGSNGKRGCNKTIVDCIIAYTLLKRDNTQSEIKYSLRNKISSLTSTKSKGTE